MNVPQCVLDRISKENKWEKKSYVSTTWYELKSKLVTAMITDCKHDDKWQLMYGNRFCFFSKKEITLEQAKQLCIQSYKNRLQEELNELNKIDP